jgi:hypothetical protein
VAHRTCIYYGRVAIYSEILKAGSDGILGTDNLNERSNGSNLECSRTGSEIKSISTSLAYVTNPHITEEMIEVVLTEEKRLLQTADRGGSSIGTSSIAWF